MKLWEQGRYPCSTLWHMVHGLLAPLCSMCYPCDIDSTRHRVEQGDRLYSRSVIWHKYPYECIWMDSFDAFQKSIMYIHVPQSGTKRPCLFSERHARWCEKWIANITYKRIDKVNSFVRDLHNLLFILQYLYSIRWPLFILRALWEQERSRYCWEQILQKPLLLGPAVKVFIAVYATSDVQGTVPYRSTVYLFGRKSSYYHENKSKTRYNNYYYLTHLHLWVTFASPTNKGAKATYRRLIRHSRGRSAVSAVLLHTVF